MAGSTGDSQPETSVVHPVWKRLGSACFFGLASIWIVFVNKIILTNFKFPSFLFLGIGQMIATILVLGCARILKMIKFPALDMEIPAKIFPLPLFFVLNLITGLGGTQKLNLPMFTVMRRFSIFMTLVGELLILKIKPTFAVQLSVFLMILGSIIAALNDLSFDAYGYTLILLNDFFTAAAGIVMKKKLNANQLGRYGLLYYNSLFMVVPAILIAYFTDDLNKALAYDGWTNGWFLVGFGSSCIFGFVLNYSILLCTHFNSALTTTCVGPIKNLVVTYVGMFSSGDYHFTVVNFSGINISVLGSILYTYVTFARGNKKPTAKDVPQPVKSGSVLTVNPSFAKTPPV